MLGSASQWLADGWRALTDEFDPAQCASCWQPPRRLCSNCRTQLAPDPQWETRYGRPVLTMYNYAAVARALMIALKEHGEPAIARALARPLGSPLGSAFGSPLGSSLGSSLGSLLGGAFGSSLGSPLSTGGLGAVLTNADHVVIPPTRRDAMRSRGYVPIQMIARAAGVRVISPFRVADHVVDQVGLSPTQRLANLDRAFAPTSWSRFTSLAGHPRLAGNRVVLLDDVVTTGSTFLELERAVTDMGAEVIARVAICSVRLQS